MDQAAGTATEPEVLHGQKLAVIFGGLMLVMLVAALDQTIVATALPTIAGDLGGLDHLSWVVTAYLLAQTVVTPLYGKLGDLYGRKVVLQAGLVIFIVGSALCGLSKTMPELIAFRALQGLGGGGLMVSAQATVGDVVSPRQRGKYQGLFGAVFGLATVVGPLLGGTITTSLSWRWIFYINLPIGVLALAVLAVALPATRRGASHHIDYLGTVLLALGLSALVLFVSLGGTTFSWASPEIVGMAAAFVVLSVAFVLFERRAAEPVLPIKLFSNSVFTSTSIVAFLLGFAMFGAITYLPLYFQVVKGSSPTGSGLQILPLMAGLLVASTASGQVVTHTGKYRAFPIVGTAVMTVGLALLSHLGVGTSDVVSSLFMVVLGLGIGQVMQVLVVAVQNAVDYEVLGVATAGNTLFRSIGSAVGTAVVGAVFTNELTAKLHTAFPGTSAAAASPASFTPHELAQLPGAIRHTVLTAYSGAVDTAFLVAAGTSVLAFVASWFIKALPMRDTVATAGMGEAFAVPKEESSLREIVRALSVLMGRDRGRRFVEQVAADASVDLPAVECWALFRVGEDRQWDFTASSRRRGIPVDLVEQALGSLVHRGLIQPSPDGSASTSPNGSAPAAVPTSVSVPVLAGRAVSPAGRAALSNGPGPWAVTPAGAEIVERLRAAGRHHLDTLLAGWSPEQHAELAAVLTRLSKDVVPEHPPSLAHRRALAPLHPTRPDR